MTRTAEAYRHWKDADKALIAAQALLEKARADEDFLRHAVTELELADLQGDAVET